MPTRRNTGVVTALNLGSAFASQKDAGYGDSGKRTCNAYACSTVLSTYNPSDVCSVHAMPTVQITRVGKGD